MNTYRTAVMSLLLATQLRQPGQSLPRSKPGVVGLSMSGPPGGRALRLVGNSASETAVRVRVRVQVQVRVR